MSWGYNPFTGTFQRLGGPAGPEGPAGPAFVDVVIPFTIEGLDAVTGVQPGSFSIPAGLTDVSYELVCTDAPASANLIVDVRLNGTTVFGANKLSIDATETSSSTAATAADVVTDALPQGGVLTFEVIQTGVLPDTGRGLKVIVRGTRSGVPAPDPDPDPDPTPDPEPAGLVFYVGGANADDANPGTDAEPFATIQAAAAVAEPGTEVRIRDGIYRETIVPAVGGTEDEPIVFTADTRGDGTICEPVISGADLLNVTWTLADHPDLPGVNADTKPIYEAEVTLPVEGYPQTASYLSMLGNDIFVDSKRLPEAQWPPVLDADDPCNPDHYAKVESDEFPPADSDPTRTIYRFTIDWADPNNPVLTDPAFPRIPGGWQGGRLLLMHKWYPTDLPITGSSAAGVQFSTAGNTNILNSILRGEDQYAAPWSDKAGMRYVLYGRIGALTSPGQWFYEDGKIYIWMPDGSVPSRVEYKARTMGADLTGRPHIHLKNLNFFGCEIHDNGGSLLPNGWGLENPFKGNVIDVPTPGIEIDYCRFKYQNRVPSLGGGADNQPLGIPRSETRQLTFGGTGLQRRLYDAGIRLSGDGARIRNSVFRVADAGMVVLSGRGSVVDNCYMAHNNNQGTYSDCVLLGARAFGCKVLNSTIHDVGRSAIRPLGQQQEIGYCDLYNYCKLSEDGGAIYSWHVWNAPSSIVNPSTPSDDSVLADLLPPWASFDTNLYPAAARDGSWQHEAYDLRIHHNWIHDERFFSATGGYPYAGSQRSGIYFDANVNGAVMHHNVFWATNSWDIWSHHEYNLDPSRLLTTSYNRMYNNTFGSTPFGRGAILPRGVYERSDRTVDNNIYMRPVGALWAFSYGHVVLKPTEIRWLQQSDIDTWQVVENENTGPLTLSDPGLVSYAGSAATSGLDFQLAPGSPSINRGLPVNGTLDNLGFVIDYVDDYDGPAPDCGAYEFGREPWVPGCTLPDEFIEGEPWAQQWEAV
jgi:hypothetical protein